MESQDPEQLVRYAQSQSSTQLGESAADLAGDLAFLKNGDPAEALKAYDTLMRIRPNGSALLRNPDAHLERAVIQAKRILCKAASGELPVARRELQQFENEFGSLRGTLAGRKGPLVETLKEALEKDHLEDRLEEETKDVWSMVGGSTNRTRVVTGRVRPGQLMWKSGTALALGSLTSPGGATYLPTLSNHELWLADQTGIYSLSMEKDSATLLSKLKRGYKAPATTYRTTTYLESTQTTRPAAAQPDTITVFGGSLFGSMDAPPANAAVAVLQKDPSKLLWEVPAKGIELASKTDSMGPRKFDPSPVVDEKGVYYLLSAQSQAEQTTQVYLVALNKDTGTLLWKPTALNRVRGYEDAPAFAIAFRGALSSQPMKKTVKAHLALRGGTLYYQSNAGSLAAVNARTGEIQWVASYQSTPPDYDDIKKENPLFVYDGRVVVSPSDSQAVFAFDALTGELLWKTRPFEANERQHLVGANDNRVFITGKHVWSLDLYSGRVEKRWPESEDGKIPSGRGLLAGDELLWPTEEGTFSLDQTTLQPSELKPIAVSGDLAANANYLVVSNGGTLSVYRR